MTKLIFLMCLLVCVAAAQNNKETKHFNVIDYGAKADGITDDSEAFLKAWNKTCKWNGNSSIVIPLGKYMLKPIVFAGPCHGWTIFELRGVLKAPTKGPYSDTTWLNFRYIKNLIVHGGGTLDGQGASVWGTKPVLMTMGFAFTNDSYVQQLHSVNSQNAHFTMFKCNNIVFSNLTITAPRDSPNTDGIKMAKSQGIKITGVHIGTGDDCIAMISGTTNVHISKVFCGPGHGISVGSLGSPGNIDVKDIFVKNCTFKGTSDGLRIKTWAKRLNHTIKASNFAYEDIVIIDVQHPINIDQEYCPLHHNCDNKVSSNVQISNVRYKNIKGSCNGTVPVSFKCSEENPCQNIIMENINLRSSNQDSKKPLTNFCSHVHGISYGIQHPSSCLNNASRPY